MALTDPSFTFQLGVEWGNIKANSKSIVHVENPFCLNLMEQNRVW